MAPVVKRPNPLSLNDQERNVIAHHKAELERGGVKNSDGSTSTFRGEVGNIRGRETLYPTVRDGKVLSSTEARAAAANEPGKWPSYDSPSKAVAREKQIHTIMEEDIARKGDASASAALKKMGY